PLATQFAATDQSGTSTSQTQVPMWQQILGGALAAAGTAGKFMASDARVKANKERVGALNDGTPVYSFNYLGDPATRIGVMAQDVEKRRPDAVREINGIKAVDYDKATELAGILGHLKAAPPSEGVLAGRYSASPDAGEPQQTSGTLDLHRILKG